MNIMIEDLDKIGRKIILRLRHDKGSPKGEVWCEAYHEGLAIMLSEIKKEMVDYELYCENMEGEKPLSFGEWKKVDEEKHNER